VIFILCTLLLLLLGFIFVPFDLLLLLYLGLWWFWLILAVLQLSGAHPAGEDVLHDHRVLGSWVNEGVVGSGLSA